MDLRDSLYRTVTLDDKLWMAQNLNYRARNVLLQQDTSAKKWQAVYLEKLRILPGWLAAAFRRATGEVWRSSLAVLSYSKTTNQVPERNSNNSPTATARRLPGVLGEICRQSAFSQLGKVITTGRASGIKAPAVLTYVLTPKMASCRVTENKDNYFSLPVCEGVGGEM